MPPVEGHRPKKLPACQECGCTEGHRFSCKTGAKQFDQKLRDENARIRVENACLEQQIVKLKATLKNHEARISVLKGTIQNMKEKPGEENTV